MNRFLRRVAAATLLVSASAPAASAGGPVRQPWRCEGPGFLDGLSVEGDGITLEGFSVKETDSFVVQGARAIVFAYDIRNRTPRAVSVDAQVVGLDGAGRVVFGASAAPMRSMVSPGRTEQASTSVYADRGDLGRVATLCVRAAGGPVAD
ncbi:hypothetical protein OPKNFCMD_1554 [Methylobacterium crusticola]|uniref:Uncharacterized protein n=1 Tax=Methylobacterium crusticola TaxID=1697972 RepID=A0ABQ4QU57_9HYPH|nr:hypothetical protein [Methylobacterium crusticola]GJD48828.1 hypothetical protein OPKNFCMD_1554 [Methylobacterium crusticola]